MSASLVCAVVHVWSSGQ